MTALWASVLMTSTVFSSETPPTPPPKELPDVESAIPGPVKALGIPALMNFPGGIQMAVSATTALAQTHVNQGLNHLHGGWEFEASRHFAAAMREDPDCLLAHWGMVMSLLNPTPETGAARNAATDRLLYLIDQGNGTELERGYAYGLIKYIEDGPSGGATAFRKVADKFPNDLQARVFAALFSRGGYNDAGEASPDQEAAESCLLELINKHPLNPVPLNALLVIRAERPNLNGSMVLARKLCRLMPDYAPHRHLLGHYEWRCGHHAAAASSFETAATLFQSWMKANTATIADCPEWGKAECYRIVALASKGSFETALAAAKNLAATPLPRDRPSSPGTRFLLWDAKTLPARLITRQAAHGSVIEATHSLPKPDDLNAFRDHSLAYWWIDGWRFILEAQRLIDANDLAGARNVIAALTQHGEFMAKTQTAAATGGERSSWLRSFRALEVLASDLRGQLAMAGPTDQRGAAFNWYRSAEDHQHPAPMLFPPLVLTPMAARLGDFFLTSKKPTEAIESYLRALTLFPNDMNSLTSLKHAYEITRQPSAATAITQTIDQLKAE